MGRPKKPKYEYVPSSGLYRHREKGLNGGRAITAKTPERLTEKIEKQREIEFRKLDAEKNPTLAEYALKWAELYWKIGKKSTAYQYKCKAKQIADMEVAKKLIRDITSDDCLQLMAEDANGSKSKLNVTRTVMRSIFDSALDANLIDRSPMPRRSIKIEPPAQDKSFLTDDQVQTVLQTVKGKDIEPFIRIALGTGMRRAEIAALKWDCVHLGGETPYVEVRRNIIRANREEVVDYTKSASGIRSVPISKSLADYISKLDRESEYVLHDNNKHFLHTQTISRNWSAWEKDSGLEFHITPHTLRRTYVTRLIKGGVNPKTVQYLVGHSSVDVTMGIYMQVTSKDPAIIAEEMHLPE